ncbi:hypothetical protein K504DRAFT_466566 [Pleomassaria siparia CBS 279.74]|uniref:S-adenosyl-L-methionine-dependent methyltransferase n=1 Tax=Pleomassaria siparia CBS 279.74 TaxID=1314801 RepID=A0A6G1KB60_9PLEO|nr:hypothetical protein K504DRAFT_466566 [Pleomassaria siparia CBS 279.74]
MTTSAQDPDFPWSTRKYTPRHSAWPYTAEDFSRHDESPDDSFYSRPRFVTHIDDAAIAQLRAYYARVLPRSGRVLDLCSSWISHYPEECQIAVQDKEMEVVGIGMNKLELDANPVLPTPESRVLANLNTTPDVGLATEGKFDTATCVVSIDYLNKPLEVLSSLRESMNEEGHVHLVISNRCFPTKAVARWLKMDEEERLQMVGDYLHFSGWKNIEIVELKAPGYFSDPLWIVRGSKGEQKTEIQE